MIRMAVCSWGKYANRTPLEVTLRVWSDFFHHRRTHSIFFERSPFSLPFLDGIPCRILKKALKMLSLLEG
jgi:hypothetical protein